MCGDKPGSVLRAVTLALALAACSDTTRPGAGAAADGSGPHEAFSALELGLPCVSSSESSLNGCFNSEIALPLALYEVRSDGLYCWQSPVSGLEQYVSALASVEDAGWSKLPSQLGLACRTRPRVEQALLSISPAATGEDLLSAIVAIHEADPPFLYVLVPFDVASGPEIAALRIDLEGVPDSRSTTIDLSVSNSHYVYRNSRGSAQDYPTREDCASRVSSEIGMFSQMTLSADRSISAARLICFLVGVSRDPIAGDNYPAHKLKFDGLWRK